MVHFRVFRWIGSDSSRNTSIKRREMLRSFRLCPLVWLCLRRSVEKCHFGSSACWRLLNSRPLGLIPSVDSSFTVPQPNVSWDVFLSYFSPPPPTLAVTRRRLSAEIMQESATGAWMNCSSRKDNMPLSISHRSHTTTQRFTIPLLSLLSLFSLLLLCSSSALPVHLPHRPRAKQTGGCSVPGSSLGHRGHRHRIQVYTTNSFMTL